MKPGTQADLRRYLESECGIDVTKQAISLLVKDKDYRIHKTKQGKIKIEETAKSLVDSGFGERSAKLKMKNGGKKPQSEKPKVKLTDEDVKDIEAGEPLSLDDSRERIEKHKAFHASEEKRINNAIKIGEYYERSEIEEKSFDLFRRLRDETQSLTERVATKCRAAETDHEARKLVRDEVHRILSGIVKGYNDDEEAVKKKLTQALI